MSARVSAREHRRSVVQASVSGGATVNTRVLNPSWAAPPLRQLTTCIRVHRPAYIDAISMPISFVSRLIKGAFESATRRHLSPPALGCTPRPAYSFLRPYINSCPHPVRQPGAAASVASLNIRVWRRFGCGGWTCSWT